MKLKAILEFPSSMQALRNDMYIYVNKMTKTKLEVKYGTSSCDLVIDEVKVI